MDCERHIKDLLPDFYLGQLPPDEAGEVRRHLAEHGACREALEEVAGVLDLMPYAVPPTRPPEDLKQRALGRALAESQPPAPEGTPPPPRERRRPARVLAALMAAAALLLVAFAGFSYLSLERENDELRAEVENLRRGAGDDGDLAVLAVDGTGRAPEARGTAVLDASEGALALDVYNMPAPPEGHSYRAWLLEPGGEKVALGKMKTNDRGDGRMSGRVQVPLAPFDTVQVTLEPQNNNGLSGPVLLEGKL